MTNAGQSVRIRVAEIRTAGRNTMGVKLMNLRTGETIQDVAKVVSDGEEDSDEILQGLPDGGEVIEDDSAVTEDFEDPSDADDGSGEEE